MKAKILNFRSGKHTQYNNQMIIKMEKVDSRDDAKKLLGRQVTWKTISGKEIKGNVSKAHGNKGALLVIFEKGLPGQSLNNEVEVV